MAAEREIIVIDEKKCTGCGECIPACPEGALQIIDGKARLVSDLFCDGLGACLGHCPEGAMTVEKREASPYDERQVMANIIPQGPNVIAAHLEHLKGHGATEYYGEAVAYLKERGVEIPTEAKATVHPGHRHPAGGCPGAQILDFGGVDEEEAPSGDAPPVPSRLRQWPVQIKLVPPSAPYLQGSDLLIAADCVPFAHASFHEDLLKGRTLLVGCPKLDDAQFYIEKLASILEVSEFKSITCAIMEVPCCHGMMRIIEQAMDRAGKDFPVETVVVTVQGERQ